MKLPLWRNNYMISVIIFCVVFVVNVYWYNWYWYRPVFEPLSSLNRNTIQTQLSPLIDINAPEPYQSLVGCTPATTSQIGAVYTALFPAISGLYQVPTAATDCSTQQAALQNMYNNFSSQPSSLNDVYRL